MEVETREEVEARTLLSPVRSFVRDTVEAAEEDLVEVARFVDGAVEMALRGDPRLPDYIKETGERVRLRAFRLLAGLVEFRKTADDVLDSLTRDLAALLKARK